MSALRLINETISTSTVSNISITNLFTDDYDVYKILVTEIQTDSSGVYQQNRFLDNTGSVISTANYDFAYERLISYGTNSTIVDTNETYFRGLTVDNQTQADGAGVQLWVFNPTNTNAYTFFSSQSSYYNTGNGMESTRGGGVLKTTDEVTGLNFFFSSGNVDGIIIRTYGLKVD